MHFSFHLLEECPVNNMGDQSWYLESAFQRDKVKGIVIMTPTEFVDPLVKRFDIQY